ncbi:MAG: SGNH/GDSL hydrolase family protein [Bacteroidota bacterium]
MNAPFLRFFGLFCLGFLAACSLLVEAPPYRLFSASESAIRYTGRFDFGSGARFAWTGSKIEARFTGHHVALLMENEDSARICYLRIELDDRDTWDLAVSSDTMYYPLAEDLEPGTHYLRVTRLNEPRQGVLRFGQFELADTARLLPLPPAPERHLVFYGNSITAGYGNTGPDQHCAYSPETQDGLKTYAAFTAEAVQASSQVHAYSGHGVWHNYDTLKVETLPDVYDRVFPDSVGTDMDLSGSYADLVFVNLGTNDFAHRIPPRDTFVTRYVDFLTQLRQAYAGAKIVCLTGSMMKGSKLSILKDYLAEIVALRQAAGEAELYRFDLSTQGALGFGCHTHPNVAQHEKNGAELTEFVKELMEW